MNDEQLERELRRALLRDDPGPVRDELRTRVAAIPDDVPRRRELMRSPGVSRLLVSAAAVAAVAVIGGTLLGLVGLRSTIVGPALSASPAPSTQAPGSTPTANVSPAGLLDPQHGWAIAGGHLMLTADGGMTWRDVTPPGFAGGNGNPLGVAFRDALHGWVALNEPFTQPSDPSYGRIDIWRTDDGGQSWSMSQLPRAVINRYGEVMGRVEFDFLDDTHGFALIAGGSASEPGNSDLYWTADGGRTWSSDRPTGTGRTGITGLLAFANASDGLIAGDGPGSGAFVTHDGGGTWRRVALPAPAGFEGAQLFFGQPAFFDRGQGVLPVLYQTGTGATAIRVFSTSDAGATWSVATTLSDNGAMAIIDQRRWVIVPFTSPQVLHTDDGGASWSRTANGSQVSLVNPEAVWFVDDNTGWALTGDYGSATLVATTDGGVTWRTLDPAATPQSSSPALVPWLDATPTPEPLPTAAVIPPGTRPCTTADLKASVLLGSGAMAGAITGSVIVTNTATALCSLDGPPSSVGLRAAGTLLPVPFRAVDAPAPGTESVTAPGPVLLEPGAQAYAWLFWDNWCGPTSDTITLQVTLPDGGGVLRLSLGNSVYPRCNAPNAGSSLSVSRFALPQPPPPNQTVVTGHVTIAAPPTGTPGEVLTFAVTLTNLGATAAPLDPCPTYSETLVVNGAALKPPAYRDYVLNCAALGPSIAPGASVVLQMRYPIPSDVAPGQVELLWSVDPGGPFDNNSVVTRVPLTIVPGS